MNHPLQRVECVLGDITQERVDAIVNAANEGLRGGGGVDGAIHRAAGPELLEELVRRYPGGCRTGEVRLTAGHELPARYVLHAVGPRWRGGGEGEPEQLASCFTSSLEVASRHRIRSLAFPAISCGVFGYPPGAAADVAMGALARGLGRAEQVSEVRMVLFADDLLATFQAALERARGPARPRE